MSVFGQVCMHSIGCHQSRFHHIPFKRKSNIVKNELPAIAITTKLHSSQEERLTFSYVSVGSRFLPLRLILSSLLARKIFSYKIRPLWNDRANPRTVIPNFLKKLHQNTKKHAKYKCRPKHFEFQNLLTSAIHVFVILAIFFGPLSASSLNPDIEAGGHVLALEKRYTNYLQKPLTYPNCSEDFDCPEDQICKFTHQNPLTTHQLQVIL